MSKILDEVIGDLLMREEKGLKTYGTTIDRDDYKLRDWLREAYEECLDKCLYLKAAIKTIDNAKKEKDESNL